MVTDERSSEANTDSLEVWAPLHACRALGQLRTVEAVEPLFALHERDAEAVKSIRGVA